MAICITCGGPCPPTRRKFCSDPCMWARPTKPHETWELRRERAERNAEIRTCPCGKPFPYVKKLRENFCSTRCASDATPGYAVEWRCELDLRICSECESAFITRVGRVTCGDECDKARARRYYHEHIAAARPFVEGTCPECGRTFRTNKHASRRKFCPGGRCLARAYKRLRRHRLRSRPHEVVGLWEIGERDGWVCGICDDPIDPNAGSHDAMGPTLDHIEPAAGLGCHLRDNLHIAHRRCNSRKGVRPLAIVRLRREAA